jgi:hypothetical protein
MAMPKTQPGSHGGRTLPRRQARQARQALPGLVFLAGAGCLLSGCQTLSTAVPPGRNLQKYQACLASINYGGDDAGLPSSPPLAKLAASIARGDGTTADKAADQIYPPAATPPKTVDELRPYEKAPFQQFLDCYLGTVDPIDYEARLVRGHIALAMIAGYSATVIDAAPAAKKTEYATSALAMITAAELTLKSDSWIEYQYAKAAGAVPSAKPPVPLPSHNPMRFAANVQRLDKILTLAAFADGIDVRNFEGTVIAAVGEAASKMSTIAIAENIAGQALEAFTGIIRSNTYAAANFAAASASLAALADPDIGTDADTAVSQLITDHFGKYPVDPQWSYWNTALSAACTKLSAAADNTPASTCLPTNDQITGQSPWKNDKS